MGSDGQQTNQQSSRKKKEYLDNRDSIIGVSMISVIHGTQ
jgi:hypothetical protein